MKTSPLDRKNFLRLSACYLVGSFLAACEKGTYNPPIQEKIPEMTSPPDIKESSMPELTIDILAIGLDFPEGPAFAPDGSLWCTELLGGNLVRWSNGTVERIPTNGRPNGLAFDWKGRALVCDSGQNALRQFDPGSGTWDTLASVILGDPLQAPNDLCFDSAGNLLFTCPNFASTDPTGYVCCLTPDGALFKIAEDLYRPNGIEIVEGGKALVVADTFQKTLLKGGWDAASHTWFDVHEWALVGGAEGPDGMALGADGLLYQAIYGDGVIRIIASEGQIIRELPLPGSNPTNAAIDPSGILGLVITETENGQLLSLPEVQPGIAIFDGFGFRD